MAGNTGRGGGQYGNKNAEKWTEEKSLKLANDLINWLKKPTLEGEGNNLFYEEFLVMERDLHPNTIRELCKKFSSFRDLIDKSKKIQETKLRRYGVGDKLNASMTKFVMINNHGYKSEKQDLNLGGQKDNPVQVVDFSNVSNKKKEDK